MSDSLPLSLRDSLEVARRLIAGWDKGQSFEFSPKRGMDTGRFACIYGLAAHAHRLGSAAITLYDANLELEALPTIRCAYEHGLTAMWVSQYPIAARALVNESYRNRKNTIGSVTRAGWDLIAKLARESDDWGPIESPLDSTARSLQQICASLEPGGEQAYSIYRLMSSMCHPGAHLVDYYIHKAPVSVQATPKELDTPEVWMYMACCSLLWAGRAVDMIHKEHPRRTELRNTAKLLGVSPELRPRFH